MNPARHDSKSVGLFQFSIPSTVLAEEMIKCELYDIPERDQYHVIPSTKIRSIY